MINITHKKNTLRKALAQAIVRVGSPETITAIEQQRIPKGNVFEMAKTAALFAAKRTSDMIPDCHPLPIEFTQIRFRIEELQVVIEAEIHTIYKTGVEVEAMHAASVAALTMYDMLKPIDKNISIEQIRLMEKTGGKSENKDGGPSGLRAAVIVCSDSVSQGRKEDRAGKAVMAKLQSCHVEVCQYTIIPDEKDSIIHTLEACIGENLNLVIFTGGTGLSPRDVTPEAITPLLERRLPGVEEAIRAYGQQRTPYAMLSRTVAGLIGDTVVMALPGSTQGAAESMEAVFPHLLHVFGVMKHAMHD